MAELLGTILDRIMSRLEVDRSAATLHGPNVIFVEFTRKRPATEAAGQFSGRHQTGNETALFSSVTQNQCAPEWKASK